MTPRGCGSGRLHVHGGAQLAGKKFAFRETYYAAMRSTHKNLTAAEKADGAAAKSAGGRAALVSTERPSEGRCSRAADLVSGRRMGSEPSAYPKSASTRWNLARPGFNRRADFFQEQALETLSAKSSGRFVRDEFAVCKH